MSRSVEVRGTPPIKRRGVVGVVRRKARFLVIKRSAFVIAPGAFCFPGGGIESGESELEALHRELHEELGIVGAGNERCVWRSVTPGRIALAWWHVEIDPSAKLIPDPREVAAYYWWTLEEMTACDNLLTSNVQFLAQLASGDIALPG